MGDVVLVCARKGVSLEGANTFFWPPSENPDDRLLRTVILGKLWDVLDYGLCLNEGIKRRSSVLAKGIGESAERDFYGLSDAEAEALFYSISRLDTRWLTQEAYAIDTFQATPEDEEELEEVKDEILEFLLFCLENECSLYIER